MSLLQPSRPERVYHAAGRSVTNPDGTAAAVATVGVDGEPGAVADGGARVPLRRDGELHRVVVTLG